MPKKEELPFPRPYIRDGMFIPPMDGPLGQLCSEYEPAGTGAIHPADGLIQCAACGHSKTEHEGNKPNA